MSPGNLGRTAAAGPTLGPVDTTVELRGSLADLVRHPARTVPVGAPRSVKDLIESVGIPHTEVAAITVDGAPVDLTHRVNGGERIVAWPPEHPDAHQVGRWLLPVPPPYRRFVLDVHLGALTRRLRLLGFDCWYRTRAEDRLLADVAVSEARILLTRDRQLLMRRAIVHGYCPRSDHPDTQLAEVAARYRLGPRASPLTRCAACNGMLRPVPLAEVVAEVPPRTRRAIDRYARCSGCGKVYWPGSHLGAIEGILRGAGVGLNR